MSGIPRGYRSTETLSAHLLQRAQEHGGACDSYGTSFEERPLLGFRFPAAAHPGRVLMIATVHPMEWIGREVLTDVVDHLLRCPEHPELWVVPTVNPDGAARVEAALHRGRARWVRGNARGIDLNRNFAVGHRRRAAWRNVWPMWNPGPAPLSEPESRALSEWSATAAGFDLFLSLHSFGRWVFYPPSDTRAQPAWARQHARQLEDVRVRTAWPAGYRSAQLGRWARWFRARGTEIDHMREHSGALSFLIEVSGGGFGRWGWRKLLDPFYVFNPPDPARHVETLRTFLAELALVSRGPQTPPR